MITPDMKVMFFIGFIIFIVYMFMLVKAITWGNKSQDQENLNDPELRNYYARHNEADFIDYDGMGNYGRVPEKSIDKKEK